MRGLGMRVDLPLHFVYFFHRVILLPLLNTHTYILKHMYYMCIRMWCVSPQYLVGTKCIVYGECHRSFPDLSPWRYMPKGNCDVKAFERQRTAGP